jgi:hypothetical protein
MDKEENPAEYFKKIIDREELISAYRQLRGMYLQLIEAGCTMQEAMAYLAALSRSEPNGEL